MKSKRAPYGVKINEPQNRYQIQQLMEGIIGELYSEILRLLDDGKLHPILFDIFNEEEFENCFGKTKEELRHLKLDRII